MSRRPAASPARRVWAAIGVLSFGAIAGLLALFGPGHAIRVVAAPSSIAADCSRDVTVELTRWLQSVPPDTTVRLRAKGCYRTDTAVDTRGWRRVSLEGNGATLRRPAVTASAPRYPKANPTLRIIDATDVAIRDLTIIGPDEEPDRPSLPPGCVAYTKEHAFDAAILLQGPHRVTIDRLFVANVYGDGVQIEPSTRQPEGVDIRDSTISSNGRQGVAMVTGSGLLIDHLTVGCSRRSGVDLEPDTAAQHIGDVTIENSTFTTWLLAVTAGGPGTVDHVRVVGNTIHRSGSPWLNDAGTTATKRVDWQVLDNVVASPLGPMRFVHTSAVVVRGNTMPVPANHTRPGVELLDSTAVIAGNSFQTVANSYVSADQSSRWSAH